MQVMKYIATVLFTFYLVPASAVSPTDSLIEMYNEPNEFVLFNKADNEIVTFDARETVRICAGESKHVSALKVKHDDRSSMLKPGECKRYTAKSFNLSPAGVVDDNWILSGTIEKG